MFSSFALVFALLPFVFFVLMVCSLTEEAQRAAARTERAPRGAVARSAAVLAVKGAVKVLEQLILCFFALEK